jgi:hypothetical protein
MRKELPEWELFLFAMVASGKTQEPTCKTGMWGTHEQR